MLVWVSIIVFILIELIIVLALTSILSYSFIDALLVISIVAIEIGQLVGAYFLGVETTKRITREAAKMITGYDEVVGNSQAKVVQAMASLGNSMVRFKEENRTGALTDGNQVERPPIFTVPNDIDLGAR